MAKLRTAPEAATEGLRLAAELNLEPNMLTDIAEKIIDGTVTDVELSDALESWAMVADQTPKYAGVAWLLTGGSHTRTPEPVTAATEAGEGAALDQALRQLSDDLNRIQMIARNQIQTALDLATRAAADRIGRQATMKLRKAAQKNATLKPAAERLAKVEPRLVIAEMGRPLVAMLDLNEQMRVREALREAIDMVIEMLQERVGEIFAAFSRIFAVDHIRDAFQLSITEAADFLLERASDWLIERLNNPDAAVPDRFPSSIVLMSLQVAGGSDRVQIGDLPDRFGGTQPSLTFGPNFNDLLADTFDAFAETAEDVSDDAVVNDVVQEAGGSSIRQPGAFLSAALLADLAAAAAILAQNRELPTTAQRTWIHSLNTNEFLPHLDLHEAVFVDDDDYRNQAAWSPADFPFVDVLAPGDHLGCQCEIMVILGVDLTAGDTEGLAA